MCVRARESGDCHKKRMATVGTKKKTKLAANEPVHQLTPAVVVHTEEEKLQSTHSVHAALF